MKERRFIAEEDFPRVDVFLGTYTEITRSQIKRLADEGNVFVEGAQVKANHALKKGDEVLLIEPDLKSIAASAEDIPLDIVYEDDDLAVVNKSQGMTVHAGAGNFEGTLVNALLFRLNNLSGVGGALRPGIVHRIDKDTSGLLVVAKNDRAHLSLSEQIKEKTCRREYYALLEGVLKRDGGTISTDLGRDPKDRLKMAVLPAGRGKEAVTDYIVEERFRDNTLARFLLHTGRTHQIRVHAKYLGHPVVGDKTYGYKKQRFALKGQLLHAFHLEFTHPTSGERMCFSAPLPDYFERVLTVLRREK